MTETAITRAVEKVGEESFSRRVTRDTLRNTGAKIGIAWVATVAVLAVFAPFIANSHPYLMRVEGMWSSPLLAHLSWADVTMLVTFLAVVAAWRLRRRFGPGQLLVGVGVISLVTLLAAQQLVQVPRAVIYDQYRVGLAEGGIETAYFAPVPFSPTDRSRDNPAPLHEPDSVHWFGTDEDGADVLSRMIHACRIALGIGLVATGIALALGIVYGGIMGFFSGWLDIAMMRFLEIFESIPSLFLLLTIVAFFGRNIYLIMVVIGLTSWPGYARFLRAEFLKLRNQDYVQAAEACGLPLASILFRHMLPNGVAPLLVAASFGIASAILAEATLSFLGLGLIDEPSWGAMLNQAVGPTGTFALWLATYPGLAIFFTVFAYNLIGEALRDAIDPHLEQRP
ncbi:MAG TPA: ABC transporter permease [Pseudomonadales bacterium]|jgi:peptide/nickel transport system permease protein